MIIEMFEGEDGEPYITAQWFYRVKDTVCNLYICAFLFSLIVAYVWKIYCSVFHFRS